MRGWAIAIRELEPAEAQAAGAEQSAAPVPVAQGAPAPDLLGHGPATGSGFTVGGILGLQRSAGNSSTVRLLGRSPATQPSCSPHGGGARPVSPALERALARAAAARLHRCPGGECECEEEGAQELAAPSAAKRLQPAAKVLGGEAEVTGAEPAAQPVIEADPSAGVPDAPEGGETAALDPEAQAARPAEAPVDASAVDTEVIDESPSDDLDDDGPVPEADETPEPDTSSAGTEALAKKGSDAVNLGSAEPSLDLGSDDAVVDLAKCGVRASTNMTSAAAASIPLGAGTYGLTFPEAVDAKITACRSGATWSPGVIKLTGRYSLQIRLLPGQTEVTGPRGNTTAANFCQQVIGLDTLGNTAANPWYMLRAVKRHEQVHKSRFVPALKAVKTAIVTSIEAVSIPHAAGMDKATAIAALRADPAFQAAVTAAQATWLAEILTRVAGDHAGGGPADVAEHRVVDPMVKAICKTAKAKRWAACATCPP